MTICRRCSSIASQQVCTQPARQLSIQRSAPVTDLSRDHLRAQVRSGQYTAGQTAGHPAVSAGNRLHPGLPEGTGQVSIQPARQLSIQRSAPATDPSRARLRAEVRSSVQVSHLSCVSQEDRGSMGSCHLWHVLQRMCCRLYLNF